MKIFTKLLSCLTLTALLFNLSSFTSAGEKKYTKAHLANGKYRIMIDKVNMDPELKEESFKHIADLGFNVVAPRYGAKSPKDVEKAAILANKYGMYYMGWLRGSIRCNDPQRQYTLSSGFRFNIYSPNSEIFWEKLSKQIMVLVNLGKKYPVHGTFIDLENYARPLPKEWSGHCYTYSYDKEFFDKFCKENSLKPGQLKTNERENFLKKSNVLKEYQNAQLTLWKKQLNKLRKTIDKIQPDFTFAIYPSRYTIFVDEAVWSELDTANAPLLACEHYTYVKGFPNKDTNREYWRISNDKGVQLNVNFLRSRINLHRSRNKNSKFKVLGGIDPISIGGEDPMFTAMSAVAMSKVADGYWVFYEGITPQSSQDKAFSIWFKLANEAIENGSYDLKIDK
jgi:hypothetical protein